MLDESIVLQHLFHDSEFSARVLPYLKAEYFEQDEARIIFNEYCKYVHKYSDVPKRLQIKTELMDRDFPEEDGLRNTVKYLSALTKPEEVHPDWLIENSEKWAKDRALYLAAQDMIAIMSGEKVKGGLTREGIPSLFQDALGIAFNASLGHDYWDDAKEHYLEYSKPQYKIPFKLPFFNTVTAGGLKKQTLNVVAAGTNSFKSGTMCDWTAHYLSEGLNVVYFTLEMSEGSVRERIDANLMQIQINDIPSIGLDSYLHKIDRLKQKTKGRLKIKQYPSATANVNHFRAYLKELELKERFKPDIIVVDYLNIMVPMRFNAQDLYTANKAIAEELRGLAVEFDVPLITGCQFNRGGQDNSDPNLGNIGESHGISATADFMIALIVTEELDEQGLILIKQLKNRYADKAKDKKTVVGVDKARMTLFEPENEKYVQGYADNPNVVNAARHVEEQFEDDGDKPYLMKRSSTRPIMDEKWS